MGSSGRLDCYFREAEVRGKRVRNGGRAIRKNVISLCNFLCPPFILSFFLVISTVASSFAVRPGEKLHHHSRGPYGFAED